MFITPIDQGAVIGGVIGAVILLGLPLLAIAVCIYRKSGKKLKFQVGCMKSPVDWKEEVIS